MDGVSRECGSITWDREKRWANQPRGHVKVSLFFYSSVGEGNRQYCVLLFMLSSVLSSGQHALATPNQPYNHLCTTASAYFHLPIDDEPHQDNASTPSYTRSLSWDGSEESSTDHSDDSFTRPASPVTPGSRHRRQQEIEDILEQKDLYNILGLSRTPAPDKMELRRAYLSRSRACHPECVFDSFIHFLYLC
jgi:hypothetical protein